MKFSTHTTSDPSYMLAQVLVNFVKSALIGLGVMDQEKLNVLASILNCKSESLPFNYLDLPLNGRKLCKEE